MKAISPVIGTNQKRTSHAKPARRLEGEPELVSLYAKEGAFPQPGEAGDSFMDGEKRLSGAGKLSLKTGPRKDHGEALLSSTYLKVGWRCLGTT